MYLFNEVLIETAAFTHVLREALST